jgi:hypothetical protein
VDPAERCANCGQPFDNEDIKRLSFIKFREAYCSACYQQKKAEFAATGKHPTSYGTTSLRPGWAGDSKTHAPKDHQFVPDFRGNCTWCGGQEFTTSHDSWRRRNNPPVPAHGQTFWAAHALTRKPKPPSSGGSLHRFVSDPTIWTPTSAASAATGMPALSTTATAHRPSRSCPTSPSPRRSSRVARSAGRSTRLRSKAPV